MQLNFFLKHKICCDSPLSLRRNCCPSRCVNPVTNKWSVHGVPLPLTSWDGLQVSRNPEQDWFHLRFALQEFRLTVLSECQGHIVGFLFGAMQRGHSNPQKNLHRYPKLSLVEFPKVEILVKVSIYFGRRPYDTMRYLCFTFRLC